MLTYLGMGERDYQSRPVAPMKRPYWEFQAVIGGKISMTGPKVKPALRERHLWLIQPRHLHGWTGEEESPAEVVVFHFHSVPELLQQRIPSSGILSVPLADGADERLRLLARNVKPYLIDPAPEMLLRFEHTLLELSLLVFEAAEHRIDMTNSHARARVKKAMAWYADHMARNPGLEEVSLAAGASPAHLRRHFHEVMRTSPKKAFDQIRFQRAIQLMASPEMLLSQVSELCGFESPSSFSRAFKNKFGVSPEDWRM